MLPGARALLLTVGATGCNAILGLDPTQIASVDAGPDAGPCMPTSEHDEDGDGTVDECDHCPHIADSQDDDADRDGVGDACDPGTGDDAIVLLDTFETSSAGWTNARGSWAHSGDTLVQTDSVTPTTLAVRSFPLPEAATIDATFGIGDTATSADAGIGIWFYATVDGIAEPDAYLCQVLRTAAGAVQVRLERWTSDTFTVLASAELDGASFEVGKAFRIRAQRATDDTLSCAAYQGELDLAIADVDGTYKIGTIGLRTMVMATTVEHVVVIAPDQGN